MHCFPSQSLPSPQCKHVQYSTEHKSRRCCLHPPQDPEFNLTLCFIWVFMHKTTTNMNLCLSSWKFSVPALYQGHFWIRKFFIQKNLENFQASLKQAQNNHFWYLIQVLFLYNIGNDIQSGVWGLREEVFLVYCPFFYSLKRLITDSPRTDGLESGINIWNNQISDNLIGSINQKKGKN